MVLRLWFVIWSEQLNQNVISAIWFRRQLEMSEVGVAVELR
jgi:hypothetical protein